MCDGCGHGHNKFAGCVQKYHVHFSFYRNGHNLSCNEIVKLLLVGTLCVAGYAKDAIVGACHRTIATGKNTSWHAGPEQHMFSSFTYVSQCAESKAATVMHGKRLAWAMV